MRNIKGTNVNAECKWEEMTRWSFSQGIEELRLPPSPYLAPLVRPCSRVVLARLRPHPRKGRGWQGDLRKGQATPWSSQEPSALFGMPFSSPERWAPNCAQHPRKGLLPLLPQSPGSSQKARLASRLGDLLTWFNLSQEVLSLSSLLTQSSMKVCILVLGWPLCVCELCLVAKVWKEGLGSL